jgi:hypothetical protein
MASTLIHEYKHWVGYVTAAEGFFLISGAVRVPDGMSRQVS